MVHSILLPLRPREILPWENHVDRITKFLDTFLTPKHSTILIKWLSSVLL